MLSIQAHCNLTLFSVQRLTGLHALCEFIAGQAPGACYASTGFVQRHPAWLCQIHAHDHLWQHDSNAVGV